MAQVQVILHGIPAGETYETFGIPIVLQFYDDKSYEGAEWIIPSFPGNIPGDMLSEVRISQGPVEVVVDGPEGFQSGPHLATLIRGNYPTGKLCAFIHADPMSPATRRGIALSVIEGSLIIDDLATGGAPAQSPAPQPPGA